jgi:hypothetical protein
MLAGARTVLVEAGDPAGHAVRRPRASDAGRMMFSPLGQRSQRLLVSAAGVNLDETSHA